MGNSVPTQRLESDTASLLLQVRQAIQYVEKVNPDVGGTLTQLLEMAEANNLMQVLRLVMKLDVPMKDELLPLLSLMDKGPFNLSLVEPTAPGSVGAAVMDRLIVRGGIGGKDIGGNVVSKNVLIKLVLIAAAAAIGYFVGASTDQDNAVGYAAAGAFVGLMLSFAYGRSDNSYVIRRFNDGSSNVPTNAIIFDVILHDGLEDHKDEPVHIDSEDHKDEPATITLKVRRGRPIHIVEAANAIRDALTKVEQSADRHIQLDMPYEKARLIKPKFAPDYEHKHENWRAINRKRVNAEASLSAAQNVPSSKYKKFSRRNDQKLLDTEFQLNLAIERLRKQSNELELYIISQPARNAVNSLNNTLNHINQSQWREALASAKVALDHRTKEVERVRRAQETHTEVLGELQQLVDAYGENSHMSSILQPYIARIDGVRAHINYNLKSTHEGLGKYRIQTETEAQTAIQALHDALDEHEVDEQKVNEHKVKKLAGDAYSAMKRTISATRGLDESVDQDQAFIDEATRLVNEIKGDIYSDTKEKHSPSRPTVIYLPDVSQHNELKRVLSLVFDTESVRDALTRPSAASGGSLYNIVSWHHVILCAVLVIVVILLLYSLNCVWSTTCFWGQIYDGELRVQTNTQR
jgi:hypothetical protein